MSQGEFHLEGSMNLEQSTMRKSLVGTPIFGRGEEAKFRDLPIEEVPDFCEMVLPRNSLGRKRVGTDMEKRVKEFLSYRGWKVVSDSDNYWDRRGIDVIAYRGRTVLLIQCKFRTRGLYMSLPFVLKLLGSKQDFIEQRRERIRACDTRVIPILIGTTSLSRAADATMAKHDMKYFRVGIT